MDTLETRGFTLIELLVVIAIIGLLSSIVLASLGTARGKAADAKRLGDMQSIRTALELYYTTNNAYPDTGGGWRSQCSSWGSYAPSNVAPGLVPTYIGQWPADPRMTMPNQNCYLYRSNRTSYKLLDYNLTNTTVTSQPNFVDPARNYGQTRPAGCTGPEATLTWAIWSDNASMCW
ncbi:MAG TPA: type II secretion system protein [Candidatus Paceibacterota bacterium]